MRFGLLCSNNIFSYLLARHLLNSNDLKVVLISNKNTSSIKRLYSIFKKTSIQYFIYRSLIQVFSQVYSSFSIIKHARKKNIRVQYISNSKELDHLNLNCDMFVAVNFDIIISEDFILKSNYGVLNTHASDLPKDKGISPVVWAYSRGDRKIYISYYYMDGKLDSGQLVIKESFVFDESWSLFRTYCEVLNHASLNLKHIVVNSVLKNENYKLIDDLGEETYNSWPDSNLNKKLRLNNRSYFKMEDIKYFNNVIKENN
jgi:folate-dependent phosphoribosylglycinamide formyltransferase PurN